MSREYTFVAENGLRVTCLRGEEPPGITDGYGGWTVADRPRRVGFAQWNGVSPIRVKIPCLFDGWRKESNIETEVGILARMGQPPNAVSGEPPVLNVIGAMPRKDIDRWVIESLDWGTNVIWGLDRHGAAVRFRQDVVVNLIQYVHPASLRRGGGGTTQGGTAGRPKGMPPPKQKFWVVRRGDTLGKIAAKVYGNAKWWGQIAKANKIRDPKKLKINMRLRMP
jgi:hypothetical protein